MRPIALSTAIPPDLAPHLPSFTVGRAVKHAAAPAIPTERSVPPDANAPTQLRPLPARNPHTMKAKRKSQHQTASTRGRDDTDITGNTADDLDSA